MKYFYERYWEEKNELEDYRYKKGVVKKLIPQDKNIPLLDFGCGNGILTEDMLKVNPSLKITGVDVSRTAIAFARRKMPRQKFLVIREGQKLPFKNNSFDFIANIDVMQSIYDTELVFKELSRVLSHKGKMLVTLPYHGLLKNIIIAIIGFDIVHYPRNAAIRFYTRKSLINEMKAVGLLPVKFGYFGRFYPFSRGMYCVCIKKAN